MKRIIIVRHGESVANAKGIIQGRKSDYPLTEKGKDVTRLIAKNNIEKFSGVKRIISSTAKRAQETAIIIADQLSLPIFLSNSIVEMEAGILDGMKKGDADRIYPQYYRIWKNRDDLDSIPGAESGEALQARVIGFLMQYYDEADYCDIIVSHAGFIRCLINTIENRKRTYKFNIDNSSIFQIDNIIEKIEIKKRDRAMSSKVFIINTADGKYVVKIKEGKVDKPDIIEQALLNKLQGNNLPKILHMQNYGNGKYCKIIKYVKGVHKYGKLKDDEYDALVESERALRIELEKFKGINFFKINNLKKTLERINSNTQNEYIKNFSNILLSSSYVDELDNIKTYTLAHNDLNRDNILFEVSESGKIKANIIDFESLEFSPQDFQFASMLACGLLLEGEDIDRIKRTILSER